MNGDSVRVDLFSVFEKMAALFKQIDPTRLEKLTEVAVTIDPLYQAANPPDSDLLRSFYQADIDYEFYDVKTGKIPKPYLFYGGGSWLDNDSQQAVDRLYRKWGPPDLPGGLSLPG